MFSSATSRSTFRLLITLAIVALVAVSLVISWDRYVSHANAPVSQLAGQPIPSDSTLRPPAPDHGAQPTLQGQAAVAHLKQQGLYDSLREAVATATYPVTIDPTPTLPEQAKLTASDAAASNEIGYDVAISGTTAVIGARLDTEKGTNAGAAYIFSFVGGIGGRWIQQQKLTTKANDLFGSSVAISGTMVVAGAPGNDGKGAAYIFKFMDGMWIEQSPKLTAPGGKVCDEFGVSVAISGGLIVVGARFTHDTCPNPDTCPPDLRELCVSGSAYIFSTTGDFIQKLVGPPGNSFGVSVDISGSIIVVGGPGDAGSTGAAYVFRCPGPCPAGSWFLQDKLSPVADLGDDNLTDQFGSSVAISGDTIVVGAPLDDIPVGGVTNVDQGSAYVFRCSPPCSAVPGPKWFRQQKLFASGGKASDDFGTSVAISGNTVVVGAEVNFQVKDIPGAAYVFQCSGSCPPTPGSSWVEERKLITCGGKVENLFGASVAISGNTVVVGAPGDYRITCVPAPGSTPPKDCVKPGQRVVTTTPPGAAYVFQLDDIVCLTDDRTGDILQVNLTTGAYKYTRCHSFLDLFSPSGDRFGCVYNVGDPFRLNCDQLMGTFRISSECGVHCCTYTLTEYTPLGKPIVIASITRCFFFPNTVTVTGDAKTMFNRRFGVGFSIQDTKDESTCCCR